MTRCTARIYKLRQNWNVISTEERKYSMYSNIQRHKSHSMNAQSWSWQTWSYRVSSLQYHSMPILRATTTQCQRKYWHQYHSAINCGEQHTHSPQLYRRGTKPGKRSTLTETPIYTYACISAPNADQFSQLLRHDARPSVDMQSNPTVAYTTTQWSPPLSSRRRHG